MQKNILFIMAALVAMYPATAGSQGVFERLTLTSDKVWAAPGETVNLYLWEEGGIQLDKAEATNGEDAPVVISRKKGVMQGSFTIPRTFSGIKTFSAIGTAAGNKVYGARNTVQIVVQPDIRSIGRLRTEPRNKMEIVSGQSAQLRVFGLWPDFSRFDLTRHEHGTVYFSANEPIASVDRDGMIHAKKSGDTVVYVRNGNADVHVMISVVSAQ